MTRALLCIAIAASPVIASTSTVEVVGYTTEGDFVRLRGVMLGASYVSCPGGPCLNVAADYIDVVGDAMFADGFETVADERRWQRLECIASRQHDDTETVEC